MTNRIMGLTALFMLLTTPSWAAWNLDGNLIRQATGLYNPQFVDDGQGGAYHLSTQWGGPTAVFVVHVGANGTVDWTVDLPPYPGAAGVSDLAVAADGSGGVVFGYTIAVLGVRTLIYNRIDAGGNVLLGNGVVCSGATGVLYQRLVVDGGFAYFVWQDATTLIDVYAQKLSIAGVVQWALDGVPVVTDAADQSKPTLVSDGAGGLITCWLDDRNLSTDVYAQRLDAAGAPMWTLDGIAVCADASTQSMSKIVVDGQGGAYVAFRDSRSGNYDVYVQHIDSAGTMLGTLDGDVVGTSLPYMYWDAVATGDGGVAVFWNKTVAGNIEIMAQKLDASGSLVWGASDAAITSFSGSASMRGLTTILDPTGSIFLSWESDRGTGYDIYAQRVDASGFPTLAFNGEKLCGATGNQTEARIVTDNAGGVVVAWHDSRTAADAYAQHLGPQGYWGLPGAVINAVRDVPGDQGGFVNLTMFASRFDTLSFGGSTIDYTLWRAIPGAKADARVLASPAEFTPGPKEPIVLAVPTGDKVLFWEYLETLTPFGLPSYGRVLATPYDSTAVYATPVEYMVITHTQSASVFFMSRPVAGISVDNLAPAAPLGLAGVVVYPSTGLAMNWRPNAEVDLDHYNLYRGATPGFVADANSLVAAVGDTAFVDAGWMGSDYYRLTAVDAHGNESGAIALAPSGVSGVGDAAPRLLMAIDQIAPNPFNPATEISFSLPATGQVRVEIHDVMGRRVRTLVDEVRAPGSYRVMWRGLDDAGRSMASGMYLCRLVTPTGAVSRSMTLVK